ncbi:MAG: outer membrane lipoprotein carrier protein LolA [Euryarchaeota archaeon]|nr:outer membrane lipoprotein carrier protein LolA [Euryarchaeota archaeon]
MKIKCWITIVILSSLIFFSCGCITKETISTDKIAEEIIEKQKDIDDISYSEILTVSVGNESRTTESDILYKKQNMFKRIAKVNSTVTSIIDSNGTVTWMYDPYEGVVMILNKTQSDFVQEPLSYAKFVDNLLTTYTVGYNGTESINGRNAYRIRLVPKIQHPPGNWSYWLWVDSETWLPLKVQTYGDGELLMTLEYRDVKINTGIPDAEFEFEIPKGARVLRK